MKPYAGWLDTKCELCDELATHRGTKSKAVHYFCAWHGGKARRDWYVFTLDELPAYAKYQTEARRQRKANLPKPPGFFDGP